MKARFVREGDALADDVSVVVRGGELDPPALGTDAERHFAVDVFESELLSEHSCAADRRAGCGGPTLRECDSEPHN